MSRRARSRPDTDRVMRLGSAQVADAERAAVEAVLSRQVFYRYHGCTVAEFEREFARSVVAGQHTLAVNSGSSALQLAFAALDEEPGFEVLVPVLGFVSAATAVVTAGGVPRFVDVDRSLGMDPAAARHAVTPATRAVLAVHPYGAPCDVTALAELAGRAGCHLVEDVAQACGGNLGGRPLGTFGRLAAFSFQHFKLLSTGEGGLVTTADKQLADRARCMHDAASLWVTPETTARVSRLRLPPGNLRMSELEGALGLVQLARLRGWIDRLHVIRAALHEHLSAVSGVTLRPLPDGAGDLATTLVFYCPDAAAAASVVAGLRAEGVNAAPLLGPPGSNRHFAGDWDHVLRQSGVAPAPAELVARSRDLLGPAVVVALDLRYDDRDVAETLLALERVLPP